MLLGNQQARICVLPLVFQLLTHLCAVGVIASDVYKIINMNLRPLNTCFHWLIYLLLVISVDFCILICIIKRYGEGSCMFIKAPSIKD